MLSIAMFRSNVASFMRLSFQPLPRERNEILFAFGVRFWISTSEPVKSAARTINPLQPIQHTLCNAKLIRNEQSKLRQQQNAAVPSPRQRCDSVHPLHCRWECSSPAEVLAHGQHLTCAFVRTARGAIRVPTVIVAVNYARVPKKRPKLSAKNIRDRDGNRCQYKGKLLHPGGSLDHVGPRSRGGKDE